MLQTPPISLCIYAPASLLPLFTLQNMTCYAYKIIFVTVASLASSHFDFNLVNKTKIANSKVCIRQLQLIIFYLGHKKFNFKMIFCMFHLF